MRLFIAIDLPDEAKDEIWRLFSYAKDTLEFARFTERGNIHITLAFLGEQKDISLPIIERCIENTVSEFKEQEIKITQAVIGPSENIPWMIWLDIDKQSSELLKRISDRLGRELENQSIYFDRKEFNGHITLARFNDRWQEKFKNTGDERQKREMLNTIKESFSPLEIEFIAKEMTLFQSTLTKDGPIYQKIFESVFKK